MDRLYQYLVMSLGLLVGAFLFYIGLRKLFKKEESLKGRSLFILAAAFALAMLGGEAASQEGSNPKPPEEVAQLESPKTFEEKARLLEKTKEWQSLKKFWQRLDRIDTFKKSEDGKPGNPFGTIIDHKFYRELSGKLNERSKDIDTLVEKKFLPERIALFLKKICFDRLRHIHIPNPHMLCRAMPTPGMTARPRTFSPLKTQIDTLLKLKSEGKIKEKAYKRAGKNIENAIKKVIVLDLIPRNYNGPLLSENKDIVAVLAKELSSLENLYKKEAMGKKAYEGFKKKLEEFGISYEKLELTEAETMVTKAGKTDIEKLELTEAETRVAKAEKTDIEKLIDSLGSDKWRTREDATKKLVAAEKKAIPFLEKAKSSGVVEVRVRAGKIAESIKKKLMFEKFEDLLDELNYLILRLIK
jgi:hypothetical protein